ncbi:FolC bifunctional protein [Hesseltinella vesiculosa]|uniref:Dihydrofolate synthetase n=1 Tax=Hesseltinella vesiculosa TaxID=101127 RepID=A0A1X2GP24_9FUNG|nr:FolC bifunctional protein [Hesseltinella vesiculosa]
MEFGLERIEGLLQHIGRPHDRLRAIHVAGTNGKGSVCAFVAQVLLQAGYSVGRFNSPHLVSPNDTIQINGQPISLDLYTSTMAQMTQRDQQHGVGASSFEQLVAAAFYLFDQHNLDFVVVEVGLGGLLDATNVLTAPVMTIITMLGFDHVAILGGTMPEIAAAKGGIIKPFCPLVVAPQPDPIATQSLVTLAQERKAPYFLMEQARVTMDTTAPSCSDNSIDQRFHLEGSPPSGPVSIDYAVRLQGDYQKENSATAMVALLWLRQLGVVAVDDATLYQGMLQTRWPGRLDWFPLTDPSLCFDQILVDGAHNDSACLALRAYVDQTMCRLARSRVLWIIGITQGKTVDAMISTLAAKDDCILTVPFSQPESMPWISCVDPQVLADTANTHSPPRAVAHASLANALASASNIYTPGKDLVVLCGSLYLVADLYRLFPSLS